MRKFFIWFCPWGPPRVKVGGGKGSWSGRQIGMLLSYIVLIKLRVKNAHLITTMHYLS